MPDSLTTKFENALIDLIERYVDDGLTNADIRKVLDARRDDDHEYRDEPVEHNPMREIAANLDWEEASELVQAVGLVRNTASEMREAAANIALAIDSGRGNEREIARAIRALPLPEDGEVETDYVANMRRELDVALAANAAFAAIVNEVSGYLAASEAECARLREALRW